ncbi:nitroreductase family protein [Yoonia sp. 2307UL14-13]|uniref:nitroreductase family protein n=1 Tax=Yoonia sp. 2307UL14-13 TaxID=3126506 RepID=UPI0030A60602
MTDLRKRFSPKEFDKSEIDEADVASIMEAAAWAPSAYNEQPWKFHIALRQNEAAFASFLSVLNEGNRGWAETASGLIFSVARRERNRDGLKNDYAFYDTGQAVAHMTVAALERGLQLHQMQGFLPADCRRLLDLPSGIDPVTAIAIGRPAMGQAPDMPHRVRKGHDEVFVLHRGTEA